MDPTAQITSISTAAATAADMVATTPQTPTTSTTPFVPTTPTKTPALASPSTPPVRHDDEPLYTEINIPLPPLPKQKPSSSSKSRPRAHTLHSLKPFHRRGSSSDSTTSKRNSSEEWPRIKREVKNKEVAAAMNLTSRHKRSGTVDALAVVPALLVLNAELFTPGQGEKKNKDRSKWDDGMI